jgi:hypothetical protein
MEATKKMKPKVAIYNVKKDELTTREMTDAEYEEALAEQELAEKAAKEMAKLDEVRQSALEKLSTLGLTEDEIRALLG